MSTIMIQPGQPGEGMGYDVHKPLPYPFYIDMKTGKVISEIDKGHVLIGFQEGDVQRLVMYRDELSTNVQKAVGLRPVLADHGKIYAWSVPVTEVEEYPV